MYPYKLYLGQIEIAAFNDLSRLQDYADYLVRSLSNNYSWDSLHAFEVKKRKRFFRKDIEIENRLNWNAIEYELNKRFEYDEEDD